ncbi:23S rRNA (uracil(1939)-C(5))-methyltransferase RlmD [Fulvivirga sp. M361]|uniref:23S rRNA (uracil(1939)-C(5))-methyltransferase RlmD n=1 Tax=Fulvivirga sp. M361 TaxID=2594266 RepID=UPI00117B36BE|nr:23S rRNA (uracil(1939)-C(5))-methyltransferase RlmD [Fulvivirga sp. M361]TRX54312.1 23S rRNA (uracil(1939)-C(5))-methyltransferase RlmD [Fulvivirga sp. M361]
MNLKNKVLKDIKIEGIASEGKCIARYEGQVIFINGVAPGDIVDLKVVRKKKSFMEAVLLEIKEHSSLRTTPFCNHFGTCGGCKWQHLQYDRQLAFKQQQVVDNFERIGKVKLPPISPIISASQTKYYRNKLEFTFSHKRWLSREEIESGQEIERNGLGFHIPRRFDKILDVEHCHLQSDPSNDIRLAVKKYAIDHNIPFFDMVTQKGYLRNLIIRSTSIGQWMVMLQVTSDKPVIIEGILEHIKAQFPQVASLNYIVNSKKNDTFHDLEVIHYAGTPYIEEQMTLSGGDEKVIFRIGPKSFFQTNTAQAEVLYKKAWEMAGLTGNELVYDLYTGTGTIANYVARHARHVVGIEYIDEAIQDAKTNSGINGITNTDFFAGNMRDMLNASFLNEHGHPDVIITDPPRAGMHPDVCNVILKATPTKIVYISCNPATQARDVELLNSKYEVVEIQPVDMFPHTHHVECVVLLELKK